MNSVRTSIARRHSMKKSAEKLPRLMRLERLLAAMGTPCRFSASARAWQLKPWCSMTLASKT